MVSIARRAAQLHIIRSPRAVYSVHPSWYCYFKKGSRSARFPSFPSTSPLPTTSAISANFFSSSLLLPWQGVPVPVLLASSTTPLSSPRDNHCPSLPRDEVTVEHQRSPVSPWARSSSHFPHAASWRTGSSTRRKLTAGLLVPFSPAGGLSGPLPGPPFLGRFPYQKTLLLSPSQKIFPKEDKDGPGANAGVMAPDRVGN